MKKLLLIFLLCALILPAHAETAPQLPAGYEPLMNMYLKGLAGEEEVLESDDFNISIYLCSRYAQADPFQGTGYTCMDVDRDGVPELIVGQTEVLGEARFLYDIWTLQDGEPVLLAQGWERNALYLTLDGDQFGLYQAGSGGASLSIYQQSEFREGQAVLVNSLLFDMEAAHPWTLNENPISEEEALQLIEQWERRVVFPALNPFADYQAAKNRS